ncbi:type I restriction endonuclease subunit S [Serratia marcescens]|nr:type I restriction endonuclease subunit S [Serratia marcescens]AWC73241.1 type I restriction endonuclease subunit S [Serratia marcescens]AWC78037.1 type I restriction endonuclease subunit S [Serratia marcescens]AWC91957.1 type I restriction endonuclease subunit S [Serratia marcescens]AWS61378.1 type I restriction endonuclease subunit S [Serratia marcescens]
MQEDGKIIHQGWSPQCEREPASENEWGVLKTTAIQDGFFLDNEHKKLPETKTPKPRLEVKAGDLLVTNAGPRSRCGIICLVKHTRNKLMISGKMYRLRLPEKFIIPNFIEAWLRTSFTQNELNNRKTGISESGLNMTQSRFSTLPVPLASFYEQKIIAEKLDTLLAQVDSTKARLEQIPQILKRFRQAVLVSAVNGKLQAESSSNECCTIDSLCLTSFDGPFGSKLKTSDYTNSGIRVVRLENIGHLEFNSEKETFISHEKYKSLYSNTLKENDLIFSSFVDEDVRVCLIPQSEQIFINKADCFCLRVNPSLASPHYLALVLASKTSYEQIKEKVQGITRPRINLRTLRSLKFDIPDLKEQQEIVRRVEQLFAYADTIEKQVNSALTRVNRITQSILAKAFRGELTAQWRAENPDLISGENSAAALLEKIKAERAASGGKKTSRRKN